MSTLSSWLKEVGEGLVPGALKEVPGLATGLKEVSVLVPELKGVSGLVPGARLSDARYRRPRLSSPATYSQ